MKRKIFGVLFALVLALGFSLMAVPAGAISGTTRYVPGEYGTIQAAINAANPGDTIEVAAGTYDENLTIGKANLTLQSESALGAIIQPTTTASGWPSAAVLITADGVTVDGFEIDGATVAKNGIFGLDTCGLTIKNNKIHGAVNAWDGCGILLMSWGNSGTVYNNLIENNEVYDTGRMGIMVMDHDASLYTVTSGNTITGNTVHDVWKKATAWDDGGGGIQINVGKNCAITNNEVYNVQDGQRGIYMFGSAAGNTITGNTLRDNPTGIQLWISGEQPTPEINWGGETPTSPQVHYNNIYNNSSGAISTNEAGYTPKVMNASLNWWGDASGPTHASNTDGTGDVISDNVCYSPWLGQSKDTAHPWIFYVDDAGPEPVDGYIQTAVGAASAGDTILVAAGTYDVATLITVNKAVAITGPESGSAIVRGTTADDIRIFKIVTSDVTIKNLEITVASLGAYNSSVSELDNSLVGISGSALSNVSVENNILYVPLQSGPMSGWNARAITVGDSSSANVIITNNTIYNVRNGIVVRTGNTATVTNNIIFNTKGGIMNYTSNQGDANNRMVTGNLWASTVSGVISHNEWDIVWNTAWYVPDYQQSVVGMSSSNNDAYVLDRRAADATACANLTGNRSHIFIDAASSFTAHPARGNFNEPFSSISLGVDAVVPGGTVYVADGTYNESVTISKNNLTLTGEVASRPAITGGLKFDTGLAGLTLQNFYVTGNAVPGQNSIVRMYGAITDLSVDNCVFDGEDIANRMGFSGGQIEGDLTVTNSEFKNIMGFAVFDSRSGSGGDGSAMGTVTFANNNVHDCNGSIVFRGLSTDRTDLVNAYGNTWNNIGGNGGDQGEQWAALEVNRAFVANVYDNTVNDVAEGVWGEGQAFQFWDIDTLKVHGNDITNNYQGIWIYGGGAFAVPGGYISFNNVVGNSQYGISVDPTVTGGVLDATNNWWGANDGPSDGAGVTDPVTGEPADGSGDKVSANVHFDPWLGASVVASKTETVTNDTVDATGEADTGVTVTGTATVTVTRYSSNPGSSFGGDTGKYVDVHIDSAAGVTEIEIRLYYTNAEIAGKVESSLRLRWWNGASWVICSDSGVDTTDIPGPPPYSGYMWAKIRNVPVPTVPSLDDLTGTPFGGGGATPAAGGGGPPSTLSKVGSVSLLQYLDWQGRARVDIKLRSADGVVTLVIPQGTLMRDAEGKPLDLIGVLVLATPPPPPGYVLVGHAYDCLPGGANFAPKVTMTFAYDPADIPDGVSEGSLVMAYWDGDKWVNLPTAINAAANTATAGVEHFTPFALMTYAGLASFSASNLSIQPLEVQPEETVTITLSVANTGDTEGSYSVVLKINEAKEAEKSITVAAGSSESVAFSVTREEAGSYSVAVDGLTGSFTVVAPAPAPPPAPPAPPEAKPPINWMWIGIIAAVVVVGLIIFFAVRRRAY